jgi:hypothetical protein
MEDEGEDLLVFAGFGKEPLAQGLGFWIDLWMFADAVETGGEPGGVRRCGATIFEGGKVT